MGLRTAGCLSAPIATFVICWVLLCTTAEAATRYIIGTYLILLGILICFALTRSAVDCGPGEYFSASRCVVCLLGHYCPGKCGTRRCDVAVVTGIVR